MPEQHLHHNVCVVVVDVAVVVVDVVVVVVVVCFQSDWFFIGFELLCHGHDRFKPLPSTKKLLSDNQIASM